MKTFFYSFQSEWLKRKRSASSWLVIAGGFFIPSLILTERLFHVYPTYLANTSGHFWETLYGRNWFLMGVLLLPLGAILATSLITQMEYKNNTWKQVLTLPQPLSTVFFSKLSVILTLMIQFFILFNIGIYLCGVLPALFYKGIPYPAEYFPGLRFLRGNVKFFIDCLPIVALQYLLGLRFRNFLVSLGIGLGLYILSLIALSFKYGFLVPYTYCAFNFNSQDRHVPDWVNTHYWAIGYFTLFTLIAYILYMTKKEKG
ncbi:MAG TPA: ABC transporter permease [Bacteroidia bacterium]|jgi:hypothetical protein|nr:ABC transporter permease [Bacteroidia bacterium]